MTGIPTSEPTLRESAQPAFTWRAWAVVFVACGALYALTACRGTQWQDPGHMIWRVVTGDVWHPLGLALAHPLHHWLGRLAAWPGLGEPAFAVTLVSAVAGAVAVANLFGCVFTLTSSRTAAIVAALSLALAHTHWQMATRAEVYTVTTALFTGECWCLVAYARGGRLRFLWLMFLLNGLGIGNHMLACLTTPVLFVILALAVRGKRVSVSGAIAAVGLWVVGTLPYSVMIGLEVARTQDVVGTIRSALFGHGFSGQVLNAGITAKNIGIGLSVLLLNFPNLLVPAAIYGIGQVDKLKVPVLVTRAMIVAAVIHLCFVVRYDVIDQHTFYLPLYVLLAIFGGIGVAAIERIATGRRRAMLIAVAVSVMLTPAIYGLTPVVARRIDALQTLKRGKPYRDDYDYVFAPWSVADTSAATMGQEAVRMAGENGLILVEDAMAEFAVRYAVRRAGATSVRIVVQGDQVDLGQALANGRPVVLVPRNVTAPNTPAPGQWVRTGDLYVLRVP